MKKRIILWSVTLVLVLAGLLSVLFFLWSDAADKKAKDDRFVFRPALITSACIAVIEKPTATKALLADEKAEEFRPFLEAFGLLCVSNSVAPSEARYDIVFAAEAPSSRRFSKLLKRTGENGVLALALDVRNMKASDFRRVVESFPCADARLWMPGAEDWIIVGRRTPRQLKLDAMLEVFTHEKAFDILAEAQATALSDVFASYVGRLSELKDAFDANDLSAVVRPEYFVTRDVPETDWIVRGDVDNDIYRRVAAEIRSMQIIRRLVLQGDMLAAQGKAEAAVDAWARAMKRNPRDPMLLARYDRLARNAWALLRLGNTGAAAKCYETMVLMNPTDVAVVYRYATCLERLGKKEMAKAVYARAKELRKAIK